MTKITFTTKEYKPQGKTLFAINDPISVNIEETNFPTKKGKKKVKRIFFFPSNSISRENIKKALQMSGEEVKKLTFEIEIDGTEIEVREVPKKFASMSSDSHDSPHAASAGNFASSAADSEPELKND